MEFLDPKLDEYVTEHTSKESELLYELSRETWTKVLQPRMLSGHLQGRALSMLSHMIRPQTILEIGTYTGYSALCLAEGLQPDGKLHTIEINEELKEMASRYFEKAGKKSQIVQHIGDAISIIPTITETLDLVFIDADKTNYCNYFDAVIDQLRPGGFIIADNVLWSGKVIEEVNEKDLDTQALIAYSKKVNDDNRVENVLFPVRDGLMICRKR
jgi:predicted O-methyltransferase YrrM